MRNIFIVQPDEVETARKMENILISLPENSGILFAGVSIIQAQAENSGERKIYYNVVIGCERARDPDIMKLLAKTYLSSEVLDESQLIIEAFRGVDRRI